MNTEIVVNKNKLNKYKLKITTLSPVHIGTGEVYEPTNYVIDDDKLYGFDEVLFYKSLSNEDKKLFTSKLNDYMQIIDFYKSKKDEAKKIAYFECNISKRVKKRYDSQYNKDGSKNKNQLEIQTTFKNPNTYRAIIPGSSIKGMLDTVLKIYPKKIKDNDVRQNLILSDALLFNGDVEIGFADRRHRNPQKQSKDGIYQIVEVIKPESTFIFSIDTSFDFNTIQKSTREYQNKRENSRYEETKESFITRIGKNVGKDYVVEVDEMSEVVNKDGRPLATHFLYNSETLSDEQFGWVKIELISNTEYDKSIKEIEIQEENYSNNIKQKQKEIKDKIKKIKDEVKALALKKEHEKEEEARRKREENQKEQERLLSLSPLELKIDELIKKEPTTPKVTLVLKAINGDYFNDKKEALDYLVTLMKNENIWKETTAKKNSNKDKDYQRTLKVKAMLDI